MILLKNNAQSMLIASIAAANTELHILPEDMQRFPEIIVPLDHYYCALADSAGNLEFVKVVATHAENSILSVVRGQEGSIARQWNMGDRVQLRMSAQTWQDMAGDWWDRLTDTAGGSIAGNILEDSQLALPSDVVAKMEEGRRLRIVNEAGNIVYGHVLTASYDAQTDLTTVSLGGDEAPPVLTGNLVAIDLGFSTELESRFAYARAKAVADEVAVKAVIVEEKTELAVNSAATAVEAASSATSSATNAAASETTAVAAAEAAAASAAIADLIIEGALPSATPDIKGVVYLTDAVSDLGIEGYTAVTPKAVQDAMASITVALATLEQAGLVKPDGETIVIDELGKISVEIAKTAKYA